MLPFDCAQRATFVDKRRAQICSLAACAGIALLSSCSGGSDSGGSADPGAATTGQIVIQSGLPSSANSIIATLEAGRGDPEGVAPTAPSVSRIVWKDSRNADRSMALYAYLYQYDFGFVGASADPNQVTRRSANDDANGHEGFGYVVSHNNKNENSPFGKSNAPNVVRSVVFAGGHHAIHRVEMVYDRDKEAGGNGVRIPVVIEWMVATGRDHPVWAVTYKMGQVVNPNAVNFDDYRMDARGPYGSLNFDGAASRALGDTVGGVAWGDTALRFQSLGAPLTLESAWTYDSPNTVNFTQAWTANVNAEMGIVQTRTGDKFMGNPDRVVGRERGNTSANNFGEKGDCNGYGDARVYTMPCVGEWPYQMMNFDWRVGGKAVDATTSTKLMAWGAPYGWLGASDFKAFDNSETLDGRGDRSYATFIVLGPKCRLDGGGNCNRPGDVALTLQAVQALSSANLSNVTTGAAATQAPTGPGATRQKSLLNGYDDTYAAYCLDADSNRVAFTLTPAVGQPLSRPMFMFRRYSARQVPTIKLNGTTLTVNTGAADSGAFVSIDTEHDTLWVTLNQTLSTASQIQIGF